MAYTITTTGSNLTTVTANSVHMYTVQGSHGGALYIKGSYTKGDETATAFKIATRATAAGTDTPMYVRGSDNTMTQLGPIYTATGRFEIVVPLFTDDKYVTITATATGSATGTIVYDYSKQVM